jgi:glutamate racemase
LVSLPEEDYLYLGDTAGFPYGNKAPEWLRPRIAGLVEFLLDRGAKLLIVACNSATAAGADVARDVAGKHGVEVLTVVEPEAEIAAAISDSHRIGVLATPTTVESGAYRMALERATGHPELEVIEVPAPRLAPIIQNGFPFDEEVIETVRAYCAPLREAGIDTLILGCTHYPLVAPMLQRMLGRDVRLVTAGHALAAAAQRMLEAQGIASDTKAEGAYRFLCTGDTESFRELGTSFLQMPLGDVEQVEFETPPAATL